MPDLGLVDKVLRLDGALDQAAIPHAFGGALAFAYYGEPRATVDIDVNLFVGPDEYGRVVDVLEPLGVVQTAADAEAAAREGQVRLWWQRTPVDLFFSYDAVHQAMQQGLRRVPFARTTIPILGPEHLLVAKVAFNRPKDWIDIEQMLISLPAPDLGEVHRWLDRLLGPDDERQQRLHGLERALLSGPDRPSRGDGRGPGVDA